MVLRAARSYEAGEEFLVSYGPKGAAGYLEENGYTPSRLAFCARIVNVDLVCIGNLDDSCGLVSLIVSHIMPKYFFPVPFLRSYLLTVSHITLTMFLSLMATRVFFVRDQVCTASVRI